jgi:radical SAM protein with 4Fe4S-binding SPASM domain
MSKNISEKTVTITLTEACNLDCLYCYENSKTAQVIDIKTAKSIIDKELTAEDGTTKVYLDFFGGEPFLAYNLMQELVEYVYHSKWPKKVFCSTCTNGTLVHGKIQDWLYKMRDYFMVGLSFDGTKEMQNYNRSESYDKVDLDFFSNCWPGLKVKMTISQKSLETLADGVIFLHEKGFGVACNLAYGLDWSEISLQTTLSRELHKLIDYYLLHPEIEPCTMLSMDISHLDGKITKTVRKWCGTGTHMRTYDIEGNVYPCQFFMPLSLGNKKAFMAKDLEFNNDIPIEKFGEKCAKCQLAPACPTCFGSNFQETGDLYIKSESYCSCIKIIIAANSYFRWKLLENKHLHLDDKQQYRLLRGIKVIQDYID